MMCVVNMPVITIIMPLIAGRPTAGIAALAVGGGVTPDGAEQ